MAELAANKDAILGCSRLTFLNLCELHWGSSPYDQAIQEKLGYSILAWEGDCPFKGEEAKCPAYIPLGKPLS